MVTQQENATRQRECRFALVQKRRQHEQKLQQLSQAYSETQNSINALNEQLSTSLQNESQTIEDANYNMASQHRLCTQANTFIKVLIGELRKSHSEDITDGKHAKIDGIDKSDVATTTTAPEPTQAAQPSNDADSVASATLTTGCSLKPHDSTLHLESILNMPQPTPDPSGVDANAQPHSPITQLHTSQSQSPSQAHHHPHTTKPSIANRKTAFTASVDGSISHSLPSVSSPSHETNSSTPPPSLHMGDNAHPQSTPPAPFYLSLQNMDWSEGTGYMIQQMVDNPMTLLQARQMVLAYKDKKRLKSKFYSLRKLEPQLTPNVQHKFNIYFRSYHKELCDKCVHFHEYQAHV